MISTLRASTRLLIVLSGVACALVPTAASAADAELWALRSPVRVEPPPGKQSDWPLGTIDRFILARLEKAGFQPAAALPKQKLIRRAYFDLWGLPPTPDDVRAFVADERSDAYERLIDRLLASEHYGQRWARYWLDVARFAETNGYERDALKPEAWRYRDWVIDALNRDKPYDRFVLEQLAGDELSDASDETRIATGFLRVGTFDDEPNDPAKYKYEQLDDLIHATGTAFLALTIKCARCHDHKFDPIRQTDYYATLGFFIGGKGADGPRLVYTDAGREPPPVRLLEKGEPTRLGEVVPVGFLSMLPALARPVALPPAEAKTSGRRTQLARWICDPANPLTPRVAVNRLWQHHFGEALVRTPDNFGALSSPPTHPELLDYLALKLVAGGWQLKPLHKEIMLSRAYQMDSSHPHASEYAETDYSNNLWWRANRQRLDAEALRDAMLSVSGQLSLQAGGPSFFPPLGPEALEGLSRKDAAWGTSPPDQQRRRSIYMMSKRSLLLPLLTTFDLADTTQPCAQRSVTTVPTQALALLNNPFVHQQSEYLARRVAREAGSDRSTQVDRAWWLALSRAPSDAERKAAVVHLDRQGERFAKSEVDKADELALASLCHVLLNLNEFVYVD